MNPNRLLLPLVVAPSLLLALAAPARAADSPPATTDGATSGAPSAPSRLHGDVEVDPTAYALGGYSLHSGIGYGHLRVDLGAYAMNLPGFVHGNKDFDISFDGYGVKAQLFPFAEQRGFFVDAAVGVSRLHAKLESTDLAATRTQFGVGVDLGYRIVLPAGFYVTPWVGVSYNFTAPEIQLGGKTFKAGHFTPFPAVHLGYRFRCSHRSDLESVCLPCGWAVRVGYGARCRNWTRHC